MDFRQLQYVTAVAEQQSITKAAAELSIAQPTLSHFIAKIEEEIGVPLFDRSTRPLSLPLAGETYVAAARDILRLSANLQGELADIAADKKGRITIGIPQERSAYMLPLVLPSYHKLYPDIMINTIEVKTSSLPLQVEKGNADFAIIPYFSHNLDLETETIHEEELLLVARGGMIPESWCRSEGVVDISRTADLPFILPKKGYDIRSAVDILFEHYDIEPKVVLETTSNEAAYRLATAGLGVTVVPRMTVALSFSVDHPDIFSMDDPPVTWDVVAAYRKDSYISKAIRAFFDVAKEALASEVI